MADLRFDPDVAEEVNNGIGSKATTSGATAKRQLNMSAGHHSKQNATEGQNYHIGTRGGVAAGCDASEERKRERVKELSTVLSALECGSPEWNIVLGMINKLLQPQRVTMDITDDDEEIEELPVGEDVSERNLRGNLLTVAMRSSTRSDSVLDKEIDQVTRKKVTKTRALPVGEDVSERNLGGNSLTVAMRSSTRSNNDPGEESDPHAEKRTESRPRKESRKSIKLCEYDGTT
ncbi:MAG: hypothetical protein WCA48_17395, partial [Pseudomonas gingeri]